MFPEYEELGIGVSPDELFFQIKSDNPSPILVNYFTDSRTGKIYEQFTDPNNPTKLNSEAVLEYIRTILDDEDNADTLFEDDLEDTIKLDDD